MNTREDNQFQSVLSALLLDLADVTIINSTFTWIQSGTHEELSLEDKQDSHFTIEKKLTALRTKLFSKSYFSIPYLDGQPLENAEQIDQTTWHTFTGWPFLEKLELTYFETGENIIVDLGMLSDFCLLKNFLCVLRSQKPHYIENFYEGNYRLQALINCANNDNFFEILRHVLLSSPGNVHLTSFAKYFIWQTKNVAMLKQIRTILLGDKLQEVTQKLSTLPDTDATGNIDTRIQPSEFYKNYRYSGCYKKVPREENQEQTSSHHPSNTVNSLSLLASIQNSLPPPTIFNKREDITSLFTKITQNHPTKIREIVKTENTLSDNNQMPQTTTHVLNELSHNIRYQPYPSRADRKKNKPCEEIEYNTNNNQALDTQQPNDMTNTTNTAESSQPTSATDFADEEISPNTLEDFTNWLVKQPSFHTK